MAATLPRKCIRVVYVQAGPGRAKLSQRGARIGSIVKQKDFTDEARHAEFCMVISSGQHIQTVLVTLMDLENGNSFAATASRDVRTKVGEIPYDQQVLSFPN